jgi:hypothetical protein
MVEAAIASPPCSRIALCGDPGTELPHADLQRDRRQRRRHALGYNGRTATATRSELGTASPRAGVNPNAARRCARLAWARLVSDPALPVFRRFGRELHRQRRHAGEEFAPRPAPSFASPTASRCSPFDGEFASHSSTYAGTGRCVTRGERVSGRSAATQISLRSRTLLRCDASSIHRERASAARCCAGTAASAADKTIVPLRHEPGARPSAAAAR